MVSRPHQCPHPFLQHLRARPDQDPAGREFVDVLKNLWWRLDSALTTEDCYYSALIALLDAIRHGTTTLMDHHASPQAVRGSLPAIEKAVKQTGLRACLCYELSDRDGARIAKEGLEENVAFIRQCRRSSRRIVRRSTLHAPRSTDHRRPLRPPCGVHAQGRHTGAGGGLGPGAGDGFSHSRRRGGERPAILPAEAPPAGSGAAEPVRHPGSPEHRGALRACESPGDGPPGPNARPRSCITRSRT